MRLVAPLAVLLLLAAAVTLAVWLEPRSLYTLAACVGGVCVLLFAGALVARTRTPRNEPPDADALARTIRDAGDAGDDDATRAALARLGRWPFLLDRVPERERATLAGLVDRHGLADELRRTAASDAPAPRRVGALHLMAWLRVRDAERHLRKALASEDAAIAEAAAAALVRLSTSAALDAVLRCIGGGPLPESRLATLLEKAEPLALMPALERAARDGDARLRFWVAHLAGRTGDAAAMPLLLELTRDVSLDVRANAAEALGLLGREEARARLHELLADESWVVRSHAATALAELGAAPSVDALSQLLGAGEAWWVRENAVRALESAGAAAVPAVRRRLDQLSGDERDAALDVLRLIAARDGTAEPAA